MTSFKQQIRIALGGVFCVAQVGFAADPLDSWASSNPGTANYLNAVAYGPSQFVAVGGNGTITTSADGSNWTVRNSGTQAVLSSVTWGASGFVAVGGLDPSYGVILTSADGINWNRRDAAGAFGLSGVIYGGGQFVAVGAVGPSAGAPGGGAILSSPDGVVWTIRVSSATHSNLPVAFFNVTYGGSKFIAIGASPGFPGIEAVSTNGVDWTVVSDAFPVSVTKISYGNGLFVGAGYYTAQDPATRRLYSRAVVFSSPDGLAWTKRQDVAGFAYNGVTHGGSVFVALGGTPQITSTSVDGTNWTQRAASSGGVGVVYGANQFVAVGPGAVVFRSGVIGKVGASLSPTRQFLGTISGVTGQAYTVEASANLADWSALTNVNVSDGVAQFGDPASATLNRRFYKAVVYNQ